MAFGRDEVATDASWPGMCQASLVSPFVAAVPAHSTWDLAALARGSTPVSAYVKMRLIFLWNNEGYFMGMLMFLCERNV